MNNLQEQLIEEFEKDLTDLYGLEDPTRTFHDHDDFLIIRDNVKSFLRSAFSQIYAAGKSDGETFNSTWYLSGIQKALDVLPLKMRPSALVDAYSDGRVAGYNDCLAEVKRTITMLLTLPSDQLNT